MEIYMSEQISFSLTEKESMAVRKFKKKHKKCLDVFHDLSGAQFTYSFMPTGLGTVISVECSCGERLSMGDFLDDTTISEHALKKYSQDEITRKIIRDLDGIRDRPSMYFGSTDFGAFWFWLHGVGFFMERDFDPPIQWLEISLDIDKHLATLFQNPAHSQACPKEVIEQTGSDQAAFDAWFDVYDKVLSKYPHLSVIKSK
jgi:hypothetical protein